MSRAAVGVVMRPVGESRGAIGVDLCLDDSIGVTPHDSNDVVAAALSETFVVGEVWMVRVLRRVVVVVFEGLVVDDMVAVWEHNLQDSAIFLEFLVLGRPAVDGDCFTGRFPLGSDLGFGLAPVLVHFEVGSLAGSGAVGGALAPRTSPEGDLRL